MSECKAEESKVCCCVDVGTVIDGEDRSIDFAQVYATQSDAETALAYLTEKAEQATDEPVVIKSEIKEVEGGFELVADFEFSCQAEAMIFQLSTR